jgi:formylglycine-generating enzyme required for sulfatase activity
MKPSPDFLKRSGYRLPTMAEWEHACRAGTATRRYYGESDELLAKYGWYQKNSAGRSRPVGSLKPNDLGLFDMLGNAWAWCHDAYSFCTLAQGGKVAEDAGDASPLVGETDRVFRGGAFFSPPWSLRSAERGGDPPGNRAYGIGFRLARTYN